LTICWLWLPIVSAQGQLATNLITMDNAAVLYSPFNWGVSARSAKTINAGAYFKVLFGGTSCRLATDTSSNQPPYSQFWARVDGAPFTQYTLAVNNPVFTVATNLVKRKHLLEVVVKSTSETIDRWTRQRTAVVFTGLLLDSGATVSAPASKPFNILIYGDSITEGVRVNGYNGIANDTDRNDALQVYSWLLSQQLPAEVGVVGFGATGITTGGSGSVPMLGNSCAWLWAGQPRSFSDPQPDLILYNEGTNDGSSITAGMVAVVRALLQAAPNARQMLLLPFNGSHAAELKSVVTTVANPKVSFGDTKGFFNAADSSDGLHPYGYANLAFIAPKLATLVTPLLSLSPRGLTARMNDQGVGLSWTALLGATNYHILRATNSSGPYEVIGSTTATNYTDLTATNASSYFYTISGSLGSGESAPSAQVNITPKATLRLRASLRADSQALSLSWPTWAPYCSLWDATNLSAPIHWSLITNVPEANSNLFRLELPVGPGAQQYLRLSAP
jgi:hypothetical protein